MKICDLFPSIRIYLSDEESTLREKVADLGEIHENSLSDREKVVAMQLLRKYVLVKKKGVYSLACSGI